MNIAFIDGQNLHMAIKRADPPWELSLSRFRLYLQKKYKVSTAYYYIGVMKERNDDLYSQIKGAGFELRFRQHNYRMRGKKKGNVDSDIILDVMKSSIGSNNKFVIVSGDGDYKGMVDYLIENKKLEKIIFPNKRSASSLYRSTPINLKADLSCEGVIKKICKQNEKASLGS